MRFGLVTCRRNHAQPLAPSHDAITTLSPLCHHAVTLSPHYHTPSHHLTNRLSARVRARPWLYCASIALYKPFHRVSVRTLGWAGDGKGSSIRDGLRGLFCSGGSSLPLLLFCARCWVSSTFCFSIWGLVFRFGWDHRAELVG